MIVPNYIPEPLEVPGNVTEQPFVARLQFVRRVTMLFLGSTFAVGLITFLPLPSVGFWQALFVLVSLLIGLELWRICSRGRPIEGKVSAAALPLVLISAGFTLNEVELLGYPIWQGLVAPTCIALYAMLCGRDYSFVGNFLLGLIASSVVLAAGCEGIGASSSESAFVLLTNAILLTYVVYDLASLLSRRRRGEEIAAVTDLYRDVFNIFGYLVRVAKHWQKHKLLSMPTSFELIKKGKG